MTQSKIEIFEITHNEDKIRKIEFDVFASFEQYDTKIKKADKKRQDALNKLTDEEKQILGIK